MPTQERIRKPQTIPTTENHEAKRMLDEAQARQQREEDKKAKVSSEAGKTAVAGLDELLDEIDEVLEAEGIHTETAAAEYVASFRQLGGE